MTVGEFAIKINKSINFVIDICKKLDIKVTKAEDILSNSDILSIENYIKSSTQTYAANSNSNSSSNMVDVDLIEFGNTLNLNSSANGHFSNAISSAPTSIPDFAQAAELSRIIRDMKQKKENADAVMEHLDRVSKWWLDYMKGAVLQVAEFSADAILEEALAILAITMPDANFQMWRSTNEDIIKMAGLGDSLHLYNASKNMKNDLEGLTYEQLYTKYQELTYASEKNQENFATVYQTKVNDKMFNEFYLDFLKRGVEKSEAERNAQIASVAYMASNGIELTGWAKELYNKLTASQEPHKGLHISSDLSSTDITNFLLYSKQFGLELTGRPKEINDAYNALIKKLDAQGLNNEEYKKQLEQFDLKFNTNLTETGLYEHAKQQDRLKYIIEGMSSSKTLLTAAQRKALEEKYGREWDVLNGEVIDASLLAKLEAAGKETFENKFKNAVIEYSKSKYELEYMNSFHSFSAFWNAYQTSADYQKDLEASNLAEKDFKKAKKEEWKNATGEKNNNITGTSDLFVLAAAFAEGLATGVENIGDAVKVWGSSDYNLDKKYGIATDDYEGSYEYYFETFPTYWKEFKNSKSYGDLLNSYIEEHGNSIGFKNHIRKLWQEARKEAGIDIAGAEYEEAIMEAQKEHEANAYEIGLKEYMSGEAYQAAYKYHYDRNYDSYIALGYTEEEAKKKIEEVVIYDFQINFRPSSVPMQTTSSYDTVNQTPSSDIDSLPTNVILHAQYQAQIMDEVMIQKVSDYFDKMYSKEWFKEIEKSALLIKTDNVGGMIGNEIGRMAPVIAISFATQGAATPLVVAGQIASSALLFAGAYGGAAEEAFISGATFDEGRDYAMLSAITELAIEQVFSLGAGAYGAGWLDDLLDILPNKLTTTMAGSTNNIISGIGNSRIFDYAIKGITSGIGEGIEEVVTDLVTPYWKYLTFSHSSLNDAYSEVTIDSLLRTFLVSAVIGAFYDTLGTGMQYSKYDTTIKSQMSEINNSNIKAMIPNFDAYASEIINELSKQAMPENGSYTNIELAEKIFNKAVEKIIGDLHNSQTSYLNNDYLNDNLKKIAFKFNNTEITIPQTILNEILRDAGIDMFVIEDGELILPNEDETVNFVNAYLQSIKDSSDAYFNTDNMDPIMRARLDNLINTIDISSSGLTEEMISLLSIFNKMLNPNIDSITIKLSDNMVMSYPTVIKIGEKELNAYNVYVKKDNNVRLVTIVTENSLQYDISFSSNEEIANIINNAINENPDSGTIYIGEGTIDEKGNIVFTQNEETANEIRSLTVDEMVEVTENGETEIIELGPGIETNIEEIIEVNEDIDYFKEPIYVDYNKRGREALLTKSQLEKAILAGASQSSFGIITENVWQNGTENSKQKAMLEAIGITEEILTDTAIINTKQSDEQIEIIEEEVTLGEDTNNNTIVEENSDSSLNEETSVNEELINNNDEQIEIIEEEVTLGENTNDNTIVEENSDSSLNEETSVNEELINNNDEQIEIIEEEVTLGENTNDNTIVEEKEDSKIETEATSNNAEESNNNGTSYQSIFGNVPNQNKNASTTTETANNETTSKTNETTTSEVVGSAAASAVTGTILQNQPATPEFIEVSTTLFKQIEEISKFYGISKSYVSNTIEKLYFDFLNIYTHFGLSVEKLNSMISSITVYTNPTEAEAAYIKAGGKDWSVDIGGFHSYLDNSIHMNLNSSMHVDGFEQFIESMYHEIIHGVGNITGRMLGGKPVSNELNEIFTEYLARRISGYHTSNAYGMKIVNALSIIDTVFGINNNIIEQIYTSRDFSSLANAIYEITSDFDSVNGYLVKLHDNLTDALKYVFDGDFIKMDISLEKIKNDGIELAILKQEQMETVQTANTATKQRVINLQLFANKSDGELTQNNTTHRVDTSINSTNATSNSRGINLQLFANKSEATKEISIKEKPDIYKNSESSIEIIVPDGVEINSETINNNLIRESAENLYGWTDWSNGGKKIYFPKSFITDNGTIVETKLLYDILSSDRYVNYFNGESISNISNKDLKNAVSQLLKLIETNNMNIKTQPLVQYILSSAMSKGNTNVSFKNGEIPYELIVAHPELFLAKEAPQELQYKFFHGHLSESDIQSNPNWIKYLSRNDINLKLFPQLNIEAEGVTSDLYKYLMKEYGNKVALEVYQKYGEALQIISNIPVNIGGRNYIFPLRYNTSLEPMQSLDDMMYDAIKKPDFKFDYSKILPQEFKDAHPELFLAKEAPQELQEKFYGKTLKESDIQSNPNWIEYLFRDDIDLTSFFQSLPISVNGVNTSIYECIRQTNGNKVALEAIQQYDETLRIFIDYIGWGENLYSRATLENIKLFFNPSQSSLEIKEKLEIINKNFEQGSYYGLDMYGIRNYISESFANMTVEQINNIPDVINRIKVSNSNSIIRLNRNVLTQALNSNNVIKTIDGLEAIFLKNNVPYVGKIFAAFELMYPNEFLYSTIKKFPKVSPILRNSKGLEVQKTIFSDLVRASFGSNNKSARDYLANIEQGNELFESVKESKIAFESLTAEEQEVLSIFAEHLNTLYNNTKEGKVHPRELSGDLIKDISELRQLFKPNERYTLPDRIVRSFCYDAGFKSFNQAKQYIIDKVSAAHKRNIEFSKSEISLKRGDLVKYVDPRYFYNIISNGSVSKEYLCGYENSEYTPLDIDFSMVLEEKDSIWKTIGTTISEGADLYLVLKNTPTRFNVTRNNEWLENVVVADKSKPELFQTLQEGHYGIRTGIGSTEIDYIVAFDYSPTIGLDIALNGFYIPVVDGHGNVIFTIDEYNEIRSKMSGLKYYDAGNYNFANTEVLDDIDPTLDVLTKNKREVSSKKNVFLKKINEMRSKMSGLKHYDSNSYSSNDIGSTLDVLAINESEVTANRNALIEKISEAILGIGGINDVKIQIGNLSEGIAEIIDIGSTGRGTNIPGDFDFDFIIRLDRRFFIEDGLLAKLQQSISSIFGKDAISGDFKHQLVEVLVDGKKVELELDISYIQKTDKMNYSTEMSLRDRFEGIKKQSEEKYKEVVYNILLAKQVLKEGQAYKPYHAGVTPQGGLGGVGIENWILQNGGSLEVAAKEFLKAAKGKTFNDFVKIYRIWDFGENHYSAKKDLYLHDNFVEHNMNEIGYKKMVEVLTRYLRDPSYFRTQLNNRLNSTNETSNPRGINLQLFANKNEGEIAGAEVDIIKNKLSNSGLNIFEISELLKQLDVDSQIEYLRNTKLGPFDKIIVIETLNENTRIECLKDPDIRLDSLAKASIIETLDEGTRIKYLKDPSMGLDSSDKASIIETLDENTRIECLKDPDIRLDSLAKASIIETLDEGTRIKYLKDPGMGLDSSDKASIIETLDENTRIECLKDANMELTSSDRASIIRSFKDEDTRITYLKDPNMELTPSDKASIIRSFKDEDTRITYLKDSDIRLESFGKASIIETLDENTRIECLKDANMELTSSDRASIIRSFKDEDTRITYLKDPNMELTPSDRASIIRSFKDEDTRITYLKEPNMELTSSDRASIIRSFKDEDTKIKYLKDSSVGLTSSDKTYIIRGFKDESTKIECLIDPTIGLDSSDKASIIRSFKDEGTKIECLIDPTIVLDSSDKAYIIRGFKDESTKIECLIDPTIGLDTSDKAIVISSFKDEGTKIEYLHNPDIKLDLNSKFNIIFTISDAAVRNAELDMIIPSEYNASYSGETQTILHSLYEQAQSYGPNQGSVRITMQNDTELVQKLVDHVKTIYPGISIQEAMKFLNTMEGATVNGIEQRGICNYAAIVSTIYDYFKDDTLAFKETFGFDMYRADINGKIVFNDAMLLVDMFGNINKGVLVHEVGGVSPWKSNETNQNYVYLTSRDNIRVDIINKYFRSKNIELEISSNHVINLNDHNVSRVKLETYTLNKIREEINNGKTLVLGLLTYDFANTDGQIKHYFGGHVVTITGITSDGKLVVSSWGKRYTFDLHSSLEKGYGISINSVEIGTGIQSSENNNLEIGESYSDDKTMSSENEIISGNNSTNETANQRGINLQLFANKDNNILTNGVLNKNSINKEYNAKKIRFLKAIEYDNTTANLASEFGLRSTRGETIINYKEPKVDRVFIGDIVATAHDTYANKNINEIFVSAKRLDIDNFFNNPDYFDNITRNINGYGKVGNDQPIKLYRYSNGTYAIADGNNRLAMMFMMYFSEISHADVDIALIEEIDSRYNVFVEVIGDIKTTQNQNKMNLQLFANKNAGELSRVEIDIIKNKLSKPNLSITVISSLLKQLDANSQIKYLKTVRLKQFEKAIVIRMLDENIRIECLKDSDIGLTPSAKVKIINNLKNENTRIECLRDLAIKLPSSAQARIINNLKNENTRIECLRDPAINLPSSAQAIILEQLDKERKIECLHDPAIRLDLNTKFNIIYTISDAAVRNAELDMIIPPKYNTSYNVETQTALNSLYEQARNYGPKQGSVRIAMQSNPELVQKLVDHVKTIYPGISRPEAIKFLNTMGGAPVNGFEQRGICNYAAITSTIYNYFKDNVTGFRETFGFDMYTIDMNGRMILNDAMLLVDMFGNINKGILVYEVGGVNSWKSSATNENYINLANRSGIEVGTINKYLRKKNIELVISYDNILYLGKCNVSRTKLETYTLSKIREAMNKDKIVLLTAHTYDLTNMDGQLEHRSNSHIMTITGITPDGKLVVSSWGRKYTFDLHSLLEKGYGISINSTEIGMGTQSAENNNFEIEEINSYDKTISSENGIHSNGNLTNETANLRDMNLQLFANKNIGEIGRLKSYIIKNKLSKSNLSISEISELLKQLDTNSQIKYLKKAQLKSSDKIKILETLDESIRIKCLKDQDIGLDLSTKFSIIEKFDESTKIKCLKDSDIGLTPSINAKILETLDESRKIECLQESAIKLDLNTKFNIIFTISDADVRNTLLDTIIPSEYDISYSGETQTALHSLYKQATKYGPNQGSVRIAMKSFNPLTKRLLDHVKIIYPGISNIEAMRFLNTMEGNPIDGIKQDGICNYIAIISTIYDYFKDNVIGFEETFGFDMYTTDINDKIVFNDAMLLVDMFGNINKGVLVHQNGKAHSWVSNDTNKGYINLTNWNNVQVDTINKYLHSKNIELKISSNTIINLNKHNVSQAKLETYALNKIREAMNKGKTVLLSVNTYDLTNVNGQIEHRSGSHIMTITGITSDGKLVVSSWGRKYTFNLYSSLEKGYRIDITSAKLETRI